MKHKAAILLFILLIISSLSANIIYVVNSSSRTLSRIDLASDLAQNSFAILGSTPNKVLVGEDYLWVVNSGDNAIQKLDKSSGAHRAHYLVELGSNPWDAILHEGYLYITGMFSSKVYKMDPANGQVLASVTVGNAPEGLIARGNKLYVGNAGYWDQDYAGSSISVVDLESFTETKTIATGLNPQYLSLHGDYLHVSCTGNWFDQPGRIDIIDCDLEELVHTVDLGGSPSNIWIDSQDTAWVAEGNGDSMYSYDALDYSIIHDPDNPFPVGASLVAGNDSLMAILQPNWGSNGVVKILHPDHSIWKNFTVGMMPTDMKLETIGSTSVDEALNPALCPGIYPNPARQGDWLGIKNAPANAEITVYNLRGQKLMSNSIRAGEQLDSRSLIPGVYLYRIKAERLEKVGRFVILR